MARTTGERILMGGATGMILGIAVVGVIQGQWLAAGILLAIGVIALPRLVRTKGRGQT